MLKRTALSAFAALALLGAGTQRAEAQQKFIADQVVAVVGNSAILYSELEEVGRQLVEQRRQQGYTSDRDPKNEALEQLLLQKLLNNQALIDSVQIQTDDIAQTVEENVQQMIKNRGGVTALEAFYHKPVFDIKEDLKRRYEEMRYAQGMQNEVESKVTITPGEVERYYRSIDKDSLPLVPEQYVYAQITKFPSSTQEAKQRVRERLLGMRERILNGARFDMLARMYSVDGSAIRGGEMDPTPKEGFVKPFADAMVKLKPGQISEVVETEYGFHLIEMIKKDGNLYTVRHILLRPVFTDEELNETDRVLDSLVTLIRKGDLTFEQAALENSDDKYSKLNGGLVSNHDMLEMYNAYDAKLTSTRFMKDELPVSDYNVLKDMKPGDVSDAFQAQDMRGNVQSKVIKLLKIIPAHPAGLKEDYLRLESLALEKKKDTEFHKWLNQKIEGMYIRIEPEFRNGEFENKAWLK